MKNIVLYSQKSINFFKEVYQELLKVNWLPRKDVIRATIGVLFVVLIISIYIGIVDFALSKILKAIIGGR